MSTTRATNWQPKEATAPSQQRLELGSLGILIATILVFYALLLRPGVTWADDWATYIQNALNIIHGSTYGDTGYIVNPAANIGPSAYPPLYPLMLVLPISIWGVDFDAIRTFHLIGWAAFLVFVYFLSRRRLSFPLSFLLVAAVGLSPYFFSFKDYITSEVLFLPLLFLTFVVAVRIEERATNGRAPASAGVSLGLLVALCIATRSVALILVPVLAAYDLLRFCRIRYVTIIAMAIGLVAFVLQFMLAGFLLDYVHGLLSIFVGPGPAAAPNLGSAVGTAQPAGGLQHALTGLPSLIRERVGLFAGELSRFWGQGANGDLVARITSVVFVVLAIYGFAKLRRRTIMHCDVFAILYGAALLVLPPSLAAARMQMPLAPLFYMYVLFAVRSEPDSKNWIREGVLAAAVSVGALSYWHSYRNADFRVPLDGIEATDYRDMFDYIRKNTEPNSTIMFDKPRTLALFTQRHSAAIYGTRQGDELIWYMQTLRARYVLFYDPWYVVSRETYVNAYFRDHLNEFEVVHDSGHYVLYKIKT